MIAAAKNFVCVRLATYENTQEAKLLESLFVGRSGQLENTVFTILSSDGKRKLLHSSRGPIMTFGGSTSQAVREMVVTMNVLALAYPGKKDAKSQDAGLPLLADVRLAINVAACDNLPLVVIVGDGKKESAELEEKIRRLAWSDELAGRLLYVRAALGKETVARHLASIEGAVKKTGVLVLQPDTFGTKATTLVQMTAGADVAELKQGLLRGMQSFKRETRQQRQHVVEGRAQGIQWKTVVPVTDPGRPPRNGLGPRPRS